MVFKTKGKTKFKQSVTITNTPPRFLGLAAFKMSHRKRKEEVEEANSFAPYPGGH
jgi:hypothetical protein